jgi:hypothetical protein
MASYIPQLSRREMLRLGGLTVAGYTLLPTLRPHNVEAKESVKPRGGAEVCIFIDLMGGPSQIDTFDVKEGPWTPADFDVRATKHGTRMPVGLFPNLTERLDKFAIIRSMQYWERAHVRGTYYLQAGRVLSQDRLKEIPSIGSVVAYETMAASKESDFLPPFVAMNMDPFQLVGCGMLSAKFAPLGTGQTQLNGNRLNRMNLSMPIIVPEKERHRFNHRRNLLAQLDHEWRDGDNHSERIFKDIDDYYQLAYRTMQDKRAEPVFRVTPEDHVQYGKSGIGDACAVARNLVQTDGGTRFIFIAHDGCDLHFNAYSGNDYRDWDTQQLVKGGWSHYTLCHDLDNALNALINDLETNSDANGRRLLDKTLIVSMGEFGRTPGPLDENKGRNHHPHAGFALFAGAGTSGGKVIGATDKEGAKVSESGWHKDRSIYPEDVLTTIYSAMGIDWTKKITSTPSGRAFEYIENISPKGVMNFDEVSEVFV